MPDKLRSRKLWVAVVTAACMLITAICGVELDIEQVLGIVIPIVGYLLGQGWADAKNGKG